jgi:hypothetical protein
MAALRAQRQPVEEPTPPVEDPVAVHQAFRQHRRKRLARLEHRRELRQASRRYWLLVAALFMLAVFLSVTIWEQIQSMFGI